MSTILVFYEGVLQSSRDQPILDGFRLVGSLAIANRVVLVTSGSAERVEHQLKTERLQGQIADIIDRTITLDPIPLWQRQIEVARARWPVSTVITSQPEIAEYAVSHGLVSLFFAHPGFSKPAQRPEQGNRTWEELTDELDRRWA